MNTVFLASGFIFLFAFGTKKNKIAKKLSPPPRPFGERNLNPAE